MSSFFDEIFGERRLFLCSGSFWFLKGVFVLVKRGKGEIG